MCTFCDFHVALSHRERSETRHSRWRDAGSSSSAAAPARGGGIAASGASTGAQQPPVAAIHSRQEGTSRRETCGAMRVLRALPCLACARRCVSVLAAFLVRVQSWCGRTLSAAGYYVSESERLGCPLQQEHQRRPQRRRQIPTRPQQWPSRIAWSRYMLCCARAAPCAVHIIGSRKYEFPASKFVSRWFMRTKRRRLGLLPWLP